MVARRLADAGDTVLLREAGHTGSHPLIQIAVGFFHLLLGGRVSWGCSMQPAPSIGGCAQVYPRGKVMGGSGAVSGLMQSWGLSYDYEGHAVLRAAAGLAAAALPTGVGVVDLDAASKLPLGLGQRHARKQLVLAARFRSGS